MADEDKEQIHELSVRAQIAEMQLSIVERMKGVETKSDILLDEMRLMRKDAAEWRVSIDSRVRSIELKTNDVETLEKDVGRIKSNMAWVTAFLVIFATGAPFVVQWIEKSISLIP